MNNLHLADVVKSSQGNYRIIVGHNIVDSLPKELNLCTNNKKIFLIADKALFPKQVLELSELLEKNGFETNILSVDFNESNKNIETIKYIYSWLAEMLVERKDTIVSFGGGVAGDVVGYVASTWLRGVPYIQIPTTLAAMADASIGGKVGINLDSGKNLVGSFYQPKLVFQDLKYLSTLPKREFDSGWAEVIKHGLILDEKLFFELENIENIEQKNVSDTKIINIVKKSAKIKSEIISGDEFEEGNRILLNYGHTIGHALEKITEYKKFLHGEAVSVGMMVAAKISKKIGLINSETVKRQQDILKKFNLPVTLNFDKTEMIIQTTRIDKKSTDGNIKWVLLNGIGQATVKNKIHENMVISCIKDIIIP